MNRNGFYICDEFFTAFSHTDTYFIDSDLSAYTGHYMGHEPLQWKLCESVRTLFSPAINVSSPFDKSRNINEINLHKMNYIHEFLLHVWDYYVFECDSKLMLIGIDRH